MELKSSKRSVTFPDVLHPDADIVLVTKWVVNKREHLQDAGDAAADIWEYLPWPTGLLTHSVYLEIGSATVLQYSQWNSPESIQAFMQNNHAARTVRADKTVPGFQHVDSVKYRHYRSILSNSPRLRPGCIVTVSFETDGPEQQQTFVDTLIKTIEKNNRPHHPGMIASHFHMSTDGSRVFNYAEFTSEEAHEEVLETQLRKDDDVPELISNMPGLKPLGFERYQIYKTFTSSTEL